MNILGIAPFWLLQSWYPTIISIYIYIYTHIYIYIYIYMMINPMAILKTWCLPSRILTLRYGKSPFFQTVHRHTSSRSCSFIFHTLLEGSHSAAPHSSLEMGAAAQPTAIACPWRLPGVLFGWVSMHFCLWFLELSWASMFYSQLYVS
jgi:hypothetical protein